MRILITGSRNWEDWDTFKAALEAIKYKYVVAHDDRLTIVHGDAPKGADVMARVWVNLQGDWRVREESHPAKWEQNGKRAGYIRNQEMVDLGADFCLAFIMPCSKIGCPKSNSYPSGKHGSHGASDCRMRALIASIRTISDERW